MEFVCVYVVDAVGSRHDPQCTVVSIQGIEIDEDLIPTRHTPLRGPSGIAMPGCIARAQTELGVPELIVGAENAGQNPFDLRRVQERSAKLIAPVDAG